MTTEQERRERFEETVRELTELKTTVDNMIQHQEEQLGRLRKMRDRQQEQLDDEDSDEDSG
ncbi:MAG: hypothetical protein F4W93_12330 [Dehalococcoidia bacterium]|nr:hypothetical protein [Dehalococcoidia bacterium]